MPLLARAALLEDAPPPSWGEGMALSVASAGTLAAVDGLASFCMMDDVMELGSVAALSVDVATAAGACMGVGGGAVR